MGQDRCSCGLAVSWHCGSTQHLKSDKIGVLVAEGVPIYPLGWVDYLRVRKASGTEEL